MPPSDFWRRLLVSEELDTVVDAAPKPVGTLDYDPWGFNYEAMKLSLGAFRPIYERYFRVSAHGLQNIPAQGRCLIIGNHSGQLPIDAMIVGYAVATNPRGARMPRAMIERFLPSVPFIGNAINSVGGVVGEPANCSKMLEAEEAIIVFPEGVRGTGKTWSKRYQLQRFGHGFMHLAIEYGTPIVPVGIAGCEETMPSAGNIRPLAKMLRIPYFPLALPFVLPAKVVLNFGEPMTFGPAVYEEQITANVEQVKSVINDLIAQGREERKAASR